MSIYLFFYPSTSIYLSSIIPFDILPSCRRIQSLFHSPFHRSVQLSLGLSCVISLSTSLSNCTYLPSLLPFDTLSPCPLIQSSLPHLSSHCLLFHLYITSLFLSQFISISKSFFLVFLSFSLMKRELISHLTLLIRKLLDKRRYTALFSV